MYSFTKKIAFIIVFSSQFTFAGLDDAIFIQGQIGNSFDQNKVKVIDSHNQVYYLPRSVFSKQIKIQQGQPFSVEITLEQFKNLEIKKTEN